MDIPDALPTFIIGKYSRNAVKNKNSYHRTYYIHKRYLKIFIENKILLTFFSYIRLNQ